MTDTEVVNEPEKTTVKKRIDKLTLNNQIVSMRKDVKRARLWVINHLNSQAKKVLSKKGNDQQKAKNARKAERYRSEMQILKHIDVDEVSKFALCSKLTSSEVVRELEKLEPDQRAMLRLAYHKLVQTRVTTFRTDHPIRIDQLVLLIRALGLKYQKKKLAKKQEGTGESKSIVNNDKVIPNAPVKSKQLKERSKLKKQPAEEVEEDEEVEKDEKDEEADGDEEDEEAEEADGAEEADEDEEADEVKVAEEVKEAKEVEDTKKSCKTGENSGEMKKVKGVKKSVAVDSNKELSVTSDSIIKQIPVNSDKDEDPLDKQVGPSTKAKTQKKEKLKIQWPVNKEPTIDRKDGDCEIKRLNLEKLNSDEIIFHNNDPAISSTKSYVVPRDSFFLGGVDPSSDEDEEKEKKPREPRESREPREPRERHSFKEKAKERFNQKPTRSFQKERTHADKKADKFANNTPLGNPRQFGGSSHQRKPTGDHAAPIASAPEQASTEANLHPSWQAKRKQQVTLTEFQGKKIKFDDDE